MTIPCVRKKVRIQAKCGTQPISTPSVSDSVFSFMFARYNNCIW
jgi:hypothetical protein